VRQPVGLKAACKIEIASLLAQQSAAELPRFLRTKQTRAMKKTTTCFALSPRMAMYAGASRRDVRETRECQVLYTVRAMLCSRAEQQGGAMRPLLLSLHTLYFIPCTQIDTQELEAWQLLRPSQRPAANGSSPVSDEVRHYVVLLWCGSCPWTYVTGELYYFRAKLEKYLKRRYSSHFLICVHAYTSRVRIHVAYVALLLHSWELFSISQWVCEEVPLKLPGFPSTSHFLSNLQPATRHRCWMGGAPRRTNPALTWPTICVCKSQLNLECLRRPNLQIQIWIFLRVRYYHPEPNFNKFYFKGARITTKIG